MCVLGCSIMSDSLRPHGLQPARLLCPWGFSRQEEWVAIPISRGSSQPRNRTWVSCIGKWILYHLSHQRSPPSWTVHKHLACPVVFLHRQRFSGQVAISRSFESYNLVDCKGIKWQLTVSYIRLSCVWLIWVSTIGQSALVYSQDLALRCERLRAGCLTLSWIPLCGIHGCGWQTSHRGLLLRAVCCGVPTVLRGLSAVPLSSASTFWVAKELLFSSFWSLPYHSYSSEWTLCSSQSKLTFRTGLGLLSRFFLSSAVIILPFLQSPLDATSPPPHLSLPFSSHLIAISRAWYCDHFLCFFSRQTVCLKRKAPISLHCLLQAEVRAEAAHLPAFSS